MGTRQTRDARVGNARCDEHDDLGFEERDGKVICEECLPDNATIE